MSKNEMYNITISFKVSGGEKGMSKKWLEEILPKNVTVVDDMHILTTTVPFYTYKEEGTKEFEKEMWKSIRPFTMYVFDNIDVFKKIHQDTTFEPYAEYIETIDGDISYRAYGVGCLSPTILEIQKVKKSLAV